MAFVRAGSAQETIAQQGFFPHLAGNLSQGIYNDGKFNVQALSILGTTAASSYLLYKFVDPKLDGQIGKNQFHSSANWISMISEYSSYAMPFAFLGASRLFDEENSNRSELMQTAEELAESLGFTLITTYGLKFGVARHRPGHGEPVSFPSGHTSMAFATAGILAQRYPWYIGVPSLVFAGATGLSRVDLNKHFASDIAVAAGIGLFFSTAVHQYHGRLSDHDAAKKSGPIVPMVAGGTYGLSWSTPF